MKHLSVRHMEELRSPLIEARKEFHGTLLDLAENLVSNVTTRSSVFTQFTLLALARIPPSKIHPSSIIPLLETFWGEDERHAATLANNNAAEQLLTDEIAKGVARILETPNEPELVPDTREWGDLFASLAIKRSYCHLSSEEGAVYESLAKFWYTSDAFSQAPQLIPLAAKLSLAQLIQDPERRQEAIAELRLETSLYCVAPNDPRLREILRRADGKITRLSREDREYITSHFEAASVSWDLITSGPLATKWPQPNIDSVGSIVTTLRHRALITIQEIELTNLKNGFIDAMSLEQSLGHFVDRGESWVSNKLRDFFPEEIMDLRNSANLSHGSATGSRALQRDIRMCALQEKLVEQYMLYSETGDPRVFSSDVELAAECQFSEELVTRYLGVIRKAPWFNKILELRAQALHDDRPSGDIPRAQRKSKSIATSMTASGCRYRDEFFDSQSEAAVGILLEKYLPSFRISRGSTFQVPVGAKRIDFFLGEFHGHPHFLEYHPIVLGRPGFRHDFRSDEEATAYYSKYESLSPSARDNFARETKARLAHQYEEDRSTLARARRDDATLHHLQNADELHALLQLLTNDVNIPPISEFRREFDELVTALGTLNFVESILHETLEQEHPSLYQHDWNLAKADSISRPVRKGSYIAHKKEAPLPIITSFAHRSEKRLAEVVVPRLFDTSLQCGRPDDVFYGSEEDFQQELARSGYETFLIPAASVTKLTASQVAHEMACFLRDETIAKREAQTSDILFGEDLLPRYWMGEGFEAFS